MELELRQEQQLSMRQLHSLRLLQMGRLEMREYLESVAQENPTVELELPHEEEPLTRKPSAGWTAGAGWRKTTARTATMSGPIRRKRTPP